MKRKKSLHIDIKLNYFAEHNISIIDLKTDDRIGSISYSYGNYTKEDVMNYLKQLFLEKNVRVEMNDNGIDVYKKSFFKKLFS